MNAVARKPAQWPRIIRAAAEADEHLILDSWWNQALAFEPLRALPPPLRLAYRSTLLRTARRCGAGVACHPEHPEQIYGWICAEALNGEDILHQVYVRSTFREDGIGTDLMRAAFPRFGKNRICCTHIGSAFSYRREPWKLVHVPGLMIDEVKPS